MNDDWEDIINAPRDGSKFDAWAVNPETGSFGVRFTDVQMRGDGSGFGVIIHRPDAHWEYLEQEGPTYPAWKLTHWRRPPGPPKIRLWTDYPIVELGDIPKTFAPIRQCELLSYDGDKYVRIRVGDHIEEIKRGYVYKEEGRCTEVPGLTHEEACKILNMKS